MNKQVRLLFSAFGEVQQMFETYESLADIQRDMEQRENEANAFISTLKGQIAETEMRLSELLRKEGDVFAAVQDAIAKAKAVEKDAEAEAKKIVSEARAMAKELKDKSKQNELDAKFRLEELEAAAAAAIAEKEKAEANYAEIVAAINSIVNR